MFFVCSTVVPWALTSSSLITTTFIYWRLSSRIQSSVVQLLLSCPRSLPIALTMSSTSHANSTHDTILSCLNRSSDWFLYVQRTSYRLYLSRRVSSIASFPDFFAGDAIIDVFLAGEGSVRWLGISPCLVTIGLQYSLFYLYLLLEKVSHLFLHKLMASKSPSRTAVVSFQRILGYWHSATSRSRKSLRGPLCRTLWEHFPMCHRGPSLFQMRLLPSRHVVSSLTVINHQIIPFNDHHVY